MLRIIHQRLEVKEGDKVIFSKLAIPLDNAPDIYGIEMPWMDNQHDISCIPAGLYTCVPYFSPKMQQKCWLLQGENLGDREFVEIHSGNFACDVQLQNGFHKKDTDGCLMYGMALDENVPMIQRSKEATGWLHDNVGLDNKFELEIRD